MTFDFLKFTQEPLEFEYIPEYLECCQQIGNPYGSLQLPYRCQFLLVRLLNNGLSVKSCCLLALGDQPWSYLALNTQDTIWDLGGYITLAVCEKETPVWS